MPLGWALRSETQEGSQECGGKQGLPFPGIQKREKEEEEREPPCLVPAQGQGFGGHLTLGSCVPRQKRTRVVTKTEVVCFKKGKNHEE